MAAGWPAIQMAADRSSRAPAFQQTDRVEPAAPDRQPVMSCPCVARTDALEMGSAQGSVDERGTGIGVAAFRATLLAKLPNRASERKPEVQPGKSSGSERMKKSELVGDVTARTGLGRTDAAAAVDAVFEAVTEALGRREEVRIAGFGQFATRARPARTARNPRTGEPVAVEASTAPTFKRVP